MKDQQNLRLFGKTDRVRFESIRRILKEWKKETKNFEASAVNVNVKNKKIRNENTSIEH